MALDQIWQQQLTLVSYGNEYLQQNLSFQHWRNHAIFNQHCFYFRDLLSQHLLAQHFQIWLEGLKQQGCQRISLHSSAILHDEHNPNPNIELLEFPHFIVSHHEKNKYAWILGKELAEWYNADNDYEAPAAQRNPLHQETFWRYELNPKLFKRIEADLQAPNWDDIQEYTESELFLHPLAQGFIEPMTQGQSYLGSSLDQTETTPAAPLQHLALLPTDYAADYAHQSLIRFAALSGYIEQKIQSIHAEDSTARSEQLIQLRSFKQKIEDLYSKFIVKVANHYQTAQLTPVAVDNPLDETFSASTTQKKKFKDPQISNKSGAMTLIIITILICLVAYYFGL